jgi:hypothetical protein
MAARARSPPPWLSETERRSKSRLSPALPPGPQRWAAAAASASDALAAGAAPLGRLRPAAPPPPATAPPSGSRPVPAAPPGASPFPTERELSETLAKYAREVLAAKPAALDPAALTQVIEGRPIQARCSQMAQSTGSGRQRVAVGGEGGTRAERAPTELRFCATEPCAGAIDRRQPRSWRW